jgi:type II secretory pathway pseudopilin PulG
VRVRLRSEQGFGLIELLMAMVMLNIGILAIVAAFNSGIVTLNRASRSSTAAALADKIMESYRATTYGCIYQNTPPTDSTYTGDTAYSGTYGLSTGSTCSSAPLPASSSQTGADHKNYRVDTYVVWSCSTGSPSGTSSAPTCLTAGSGRPLKKGTVVVRDAAKLTARPYTRLASTFDASTG